jgi:hypothetical protein
MSISFGSEVRAARIICIFCVVKEALAMVVATCRWSAASREGRRKKWVATAKQRGERKKYGFGSQRDAFSVE